MKYGENSFLAMGDANLIEFVPQPLSANLVDWMASGCDQH
jgi:hypothetical protein